MLQGKIRLRDSIIREPELPVSPEVLAQMQQQQEVELTKKPYFHPVPARFSDCISDCERTRLIHEWHSELRSKKMIEEMNG